MYNFLCSDSLLYTSFFFFLLYIVFIHVIVHANNSRQILGKNSSECYIEHWGEQRQVLHRFVISEIH